MNRRIGGLLHIRLLGGGKISRKVTFVLKRYNPLLCRKDITDLKP